MRIALSILLVSLLGTSFAQAAEEKAVFAGGCFWCVESDFEGVDGVSAAVSGYVGGTVENPTYKQVTAGGTGHYEAVEITFDSEVVSYQELVDIFWRTVDPLDAGGQFCDRGESYRTAIFAKDDGQMQIAKASKATASEALGQEIVTPILPDAPFYLAEDYHQDYYKKNKVQYNFYRFSCGRNGRVDDIWGDQAYQGIEGH